MINNLWKYFSFNNICQIPFTHVFSQFVMRLRAYLVYDGLYVVSNGKALRNAINDNLKYSLSNIPHERSILGYFLSYPSRHQDRLKCWNPRTPGKTWHRPHPGPTATKGFPLSWKIGKLVKFYNICIYVTSSLFQYKTNIRYWSRTVCLIYSFVSDLKIYYNVMGRVCGVFNGSTGAIEFNLRGKV